MGADNPDNLYQGASINGMYDYRIRGTRGFLDHEKLEVSADGSFEIIVSQKEHRGNWLPMTAKTRSLNIRQTFLDRGSERPADSDPAPVAAAPKITAPSARSPRHGMRAGAVRRTCRSAARATIASRSCWRPLLRAVTSATSAGSAVCGEPES